ncbi:DUF6431 domain-containing protein [Alicyclobacillus dauci]|uniref:DUF6431 domain-containing protein n=1 Tax=Alicyclobacillus dauci TaxID=1475485 RepID=A0ABY6ZAV6_9BACL|nr:DUF6431 domain-containing protein [Alicyclobacillus dauci]WAH39366.1 DUF6431 domain-containing protein [Alicyclobacillus dauci]
MVGSRRRGYVQSSGELVKLIIRRLQCKDCKRIHHELPNILVPYKRHEAASIEQAVQEVNPAVAADESTLYRWRSWFQVWAVYATRCLSALAHRYGFPVKESSNSTQSSLQQLGQWVGHVDKWLGQIVRPITNANLWVQTRSAFLSAPSPSTFMLALP